MKDSYDSFDSHGALPTGASRLPLQTLQPGQKVGRFQLLEILGQGGMGQVWKAVDPQRHDEIHDGHVVLKFLPDALRFNDDATADFKGAYRRVQALHHEYICPLFDLGEEPGLGCFQVMQFVKGVTLRKLIREDDPDRQGFSVSRIVELLSPVATALDYAHGNKIIHRDIKPENLIVDPETGEIHVIDFGLAAQVRTSMSQYSQQRMSASGTEAYMAPEQWQGQMQDGASDQWALAVVAWELLTGNLPFHGDGSQLGFAVLYAELVDLDESLSHLQKVFTQAMNKDRNQRFQSCGEFIKTLAETKLEAPAIIVPQQPPLLGFPANQTEVQQVQQEWASYLNIPVVSQHHCGEMVLIPPGEFLMGSAQSADELVQIFARFEPKVEWVADEQPQHLVRITRPFLMGKSALTISAFQDFVTATGYLTEAERDGEGGHGYDAQADKFEGRLPKYHWKNTGWEQSPLHPVVNVSHNDTTAYLEYLNKQRPLSNSTTGTYSLPGEAQWEYACRAGTGAFYYNGNDPEGLAKIGNVADGTKREKWSHWKGIDARGGYLFTAPIGQFQPNSFGLCDMLGNVWEWCQDWYEKDYYESSPVEDPTGPTSGSSRVLRGGSWFNPAVGCRSAFRSSFDPSFRGLSVGVRVLCELVSSSVIPSTSGGSGV